MKRFLASLSLAAAVLLCLPASVSAIGNDNPTGVTGEHHGQIETGGSYDPYTGNAKRVVTDLEVTASVGTYPLRWTRILNTRNPRGTWAHSYSCNGWVRFGSKNGDGDGEDFYEGPDARINYPDGREVDLYGGNGKYTSWLGDRPGPPLVLLPDGNYELQMQDGGRVVFRVTSTSTKTSATGNTSTVVTLRGQLIVDPYGQTTTLIYDDVSGRLFQIKEPAGRFLQVNYDASGFVGSVQSFTANGALIDTVSYTYEWLTFNEKTYAGNYLTRVTYSDGAAASYTYQSCNVTPQVAILPPPKAPPLIKTCDDPRFAGPMKKIKYEFMPSGGRPPAFGQLKAEKNATTGEVVSQVTYPDGDPGEYPLYDPRPYLRTETRGDGSIRTFQYGDGTYALPPSILSDYTDFKGQRSHLSGSYPVASATFQKSFTDARGNTSIDEFDFATGALLKVTHPGGAFVSWTYSDPIFPIFVTSSTDELGHTTWYDRDGNNRIWRTRFPDGSYEEFRYNSFGQVTDHRLASGLWEHKNYDTGGLLEREWNDHDGWENRKEYTYWQPGEAGGVADMVKTVQDGFARTRGLAYNTRTHYNKRGQVTEIHYPSTGFSPDPHVRYGYNKYGDRTSSTDELGHTTITDYDEYGRPIKVTEPLNVQNWNGSAFVPSRVREFTYERYRNGVAYAASIHTSKQWRTQIEPVYDAAGNRRVTIREYDVNDRLESQRTGCQRAPDGSYSCPDSATELFTYDAVGNKKTYRDPMDRETTYETDNRNRLKKTIAPLNRTTENWYDYAGNKTDVQFPDGSWNRWRNFDAFGQAWQSFDERNNQTDFVYERGPMKALLSVTTYRDRDSGGTEPQTTSFWSDGMGRPWRTNYPDGTFEETLREFALVKTWQNRKNQIKRTGYDNRQREEASWWDGDAAPRIDRRMDDAGRLSWIENNVSRIDYRYDDSNQLLEEGTTVAGSGARVRVGYERYETGEPSHFTHPMGWRGRRDYTARGQLKATGWDNAASQWEYKLIDNVYHADGALWYAPRGNGAQSGFGYDGTGRLQVAHTHRAWPYYQNYSHRTYWRDSRDRITAWQKHTDNGGFNWREDGRGERYEYDPEGQLNRAYYEAPNPSVTGDGYQSDDNFGSWDGNWQWRGYDALGNRRGNSYQWNQGWTWYNRRDNGLNQYTSWGPWAATYDDQFYGAPGNGVLMQDGWITAGYNALNQPTAVYSPGLPPDHFMWFGYDPLGRCVKRWIAPAHASDPATNPATYYYYDGWSLVQEGPSATSAEWIYFHGSRIDELVASHHFPSGGWNFYHYDGRGHVTFLTDQNGDLVEQYDYRAFGEPLFFDRWGNQLGGTQRGNRFLFTGREWLADLKLYDYRHRLYHPAMGRFLQPDPVGFAAGDKNLYRYCHNDPINNTDPTGLVLSRSDPEPRRNQADWMWEFAKGTDSSNRSQGSLQDRLNGLFMGQVSAVRAELKVQYAGYSESGPGGRPVVARAINLLRSKPHGRFLLSGRGTLEIRPTNAKNKLHIEGGRGVYRLFLNPKDSLFYDADTYRSVYRDNPAERPPMTNPDAARASVIGHELGHRFERDEVRTVRYHENPVRDEHSLPLRRSYGGDHVPIDE